MVPSRRYNQNWLPSIFNDFFDNELREDQLYKREFSEHCIECASKPICNGCARRFGCKQCL